MKKGGLDLHHQNKLRKLLQNGHSIADASYLLQCTEECAQSFADHWGLSEVESDDDGIPEDED